MLTNLDTIVLSFTFAIENWKNCVDGEGQVTHHRALRVGPHAHHSPRHFFALVVAAQLFL